MTDELTTRLQNATSEVSLSDDVKATHLSAIAEALQDTPVVPLDRVSRRRRVIAAVTAAALIGPTGLAAASGGALPGEPLYGVKQVSEQVTSLFDPEVIARHRIEEAEALAMLGRRSDDAITKATEAVADLPDDHALRHRLAALAADDDDSERSRDRDPAMQPDSDDGDGDTSDDGVTGDDIDEDTEDAGQPDDSDGDAADGDGDFLHDDGDDEGDDVTEDGEQPDDSDDFDDDSDDHADDSDSAGDD